MWEAASAAEASLDSSHQQLFRPAGWLATVDTQAIQNPLARQLYKQTSSQTRKKWICFAARCWQCAMSEAADTTRESCRHVSTHRVSQTSHQVHRLLREPLHGCTEPEEEGEAGDGRDSWCHPLKRHHLCSMSGAPCSTGWRGGDIAPRGFKDDLPSSLVV